MEPKQNPDGPQDLHNTSVALNIAKKIFLVTALAGAWFLLDWLMNGK